MAKAKAKSSPSTLKQALLGSLLFSILAMAPVLTHFSTYKFGPNFGGFGSDSYGFLYSMWIYAQPADGVIRSDTRDLLTESPAGRPIAKHIQLGSGAAYLLAGVGVPPVAAYNFFTWLWFFLAYFFAFQVGKSLNFSNGVAHLAAFVVGLNPYQSLQAVDHIDLAMTWPILLNILLLVRLLLHNQIWAFPALIALTGLSVFSHPYYLIFLLFINALPLLWFTIRVTLRKEKATPAFIAVSAASAAVCGGAVVFWKSLFTGDGGGIADVGRDIQHLYVYSTKIWDFILPPHFSAPFAQFTTQFKTEQTMNTGSNFVENTLYPGLLVLFTFALVIGYALVYRKQAMTWIRSNPMLAFLGANLLLIPIIFSISPSFNVFGFDVPTPTVLVHKFLPQFRTMSRLGYVAAVALVFIFAFAVQMRFNKKPILWLLGFLFVIDLGYFHKNYYSDTSKVPEVYTYLRDSTPTKAVVFEIPFVWGYLTTYWQSYHRRANFAFFDTAAPNFAAMAAANQMNLDRLISFSREHKIDYLVVHSATELALPFTKFENNPDDTWLFFLFGRYSYVIPVASVR